LIVTQELIDEINSDLVKFQSIVVVLQYRGYDGTSVVELKNNEIIGTVTYFEKHSNEILLKKQIPLGAISIFGIMGLFNELESSGNPLPFNEQVIMINSAYGLVGGMASFMHESDPEYEISSGIILSSIGAYHPSVDNTIILQKEDFSNGMTSETYRQIQSMSSHLKSPKHQIIEGIHPAAVICQEELELVFKQSDNSPACVKPETAEKLVQRGWAIS